MTTRFLACLLVASVTLGGAPVVAKSHRRHAKAQPESFDGSCEFSGAVTFTPPMTAAPQPIAQHASALGTCTGRFVDRQGRARRLNAAEVAYAAESSGDSASCAFGLAAGEGALTFPTGTIAFDMAEYRAGATPAIRLDGKHGGGAWLAVTPSPDADPVAAVQACNGDGLERFELDGRMQTDGAIRG